MIFEDADLDRALDAAVFMIFSNNGERCTAGSRILVQQSIYADFAAKFAERAKRITVGDPQDEQTLIGPMISQGHLAKVRSYIELGPKEGATLLAATDYVTPAIEIIDARIEQFDRHTKLMRKVFDTISDNAANAGIVVGAGRADARAISRPWVGAILRQNGMVEETGLAAGVQGDPAIGIAWLAGKLAPWGESLKAGQIVLAGSFTRPVAAKAGDVFEADYGPLGQLHFRFV